MQAFTQAQRQGAEALLRKLPGVFAARLLTEDASEDLTAIHVLADAARNPKQVVRDVQSALSAAYGLDIDHRIVSVAQVPAPMVAPAAPAKDARVRFIGLSYQEDARRCRLEVSLALEEETVQGVAEGKPGPRWRDRLAAQATLAAVHRLLEEEPYVLLHVQRVQSGPAALSVVLVQAVDSDAILTGSAVLEDGELRGVVRAALDAVNRNLAWRLRLIGKETGSSDPLDGGPSWMI